MALKGKINKTAFTALDDSLKSFYKELGDDYVLDVEDMKHEDDIRALKSAKDNESQIAKDLRAEVNSLKSKLSEAEKGQEGKIKTVEEVENQWKQKYTDLETTMTSKLSQTKANYHKTLISKEAEILANELFVSPKLGLPHLQSKLTLEETDNGYVTKVLGDDGKPSIKTIDELKKEIVENADFKYILKGNKASGSATQPNGSSAAGEEKSFKDMPVKEALAHIKQKHNIQTG